jgi:2-methylcitrate dehydratase PrpD
MQPIENGPVETQIAGYISKAARTDVPEAVLTRARCHLLDTLAAIISGRFLPAGEFGYRFAGAAGTRGEASLLGSGEAASLEYAAFANAMAAHADETDDSHARGRFHPGCAIIPAALAVAEREGASSDALMKSIALGFDIGARATIALGFTSPKTTAVSTHSFGALFGASAAAGALIGLNQTQAEALLSFTVQQASGLSYWNRDPDHVEKSFDFGAKAARNGVFAALLAKAGMTAPDRPLTGTNSYLAAYAENPSEEALTDGLGTRYEIELASIKKWSVGSPIQSVLDGVEILFGSRPVDPDSIASIEVQLPSNRIHVVDDRHMPAICSQHLVAIALLDGRVTFESSHDEARMRAPDVRALRAKIQLAANEDLTHARPERQSIVTVRMVSGEVLRQHTKVVRGTPDDPMPPAEVAAKARDILAPLLPDGGARLAKMCLEEDFTLRALTEACRLDSGLLQRAG